MTYGKVVEYAVIYAFIKMLIPLFGGDEDDWKSMLPFEPSTMTTEAFNIFKRTVRSVQDYFEGEADVKDLRVLIDSGLLLLKVP